MTTSEFLKKRLYGVIAPSTRVRTIVWRFSLGEIEWEEVFVEGRHETIEEQEMSFRSALDGLAEILTPKPTGPTPTVAAKNWRGL